MLCGCTVTTYLCSVWRTTRWVWQQRFPFLHLNLNARSPDPSVQPNCACKFHTVLWRCQENSGKLWRHHGQQLLCGDKRHRLSTTGLVTALCLPHFLLPHFDLNTLIIAHLTIYPYMTVWHKQIIVKLFFFSNSTNRIPELLHRKWSIWGKRQCRICWSNKKVTHTWAYDMQTSQISICIFMGQLWLLFVGSQICCRQTALLAPRQASLNRLHSPLVKKKPNTFIHATHDIYHCVHKKCVLHEGLWCNKKWLSGAIQALKTVFDMNTP